MTLQIGLEGTGTIGLGFHSCLSVVISDSTSWQRFYLLIVASVAVAVAVKDYKSIFSCSSSRP